ncbi:hypothetical protein BC567DRAFT_89628 [Phyllosticta citribraziliensis]
MHPGVVNFLVVYLFMPFAHRVNLFFSLIQFLFLWLSHHDCLFELAVEPNILGNGQLMSSDASEAPEIVHLTRIHIVAPVSATARHVETAV